MRLSKLLFLTGLFGSLIAAACQTQKPLVLEYTKYQNEAAVPRISAEEAKKDYDAGNAVFVDSRGKTAFDAEHLPGAIVLAQNATGEYDFDTLPKGKKIIVYCS